MQRVINNQPQTFVPLHSFREQWNLPAEFAIEYFEPKDYSGLGSLEGAGAALESIKQQVTQRVSKSIKLTEALSQTDALVILFEHALKGANSKIGLRQVEIDFAVAGFSDVIHAVVYELVRLTHAGGDALQSFAFEPIYQHWLDNSTRVGTAAKSYNANDNTFIVHVIYDAYGRMGLEVSVDDTVTYVHDPTLACPAGNFMHGLCQNVGEALHQAFIAGKQA